MPVVTWRLPGGYTEVSGSPWTTPANIETETVDYASKAIAAKNTTYELAGTTFGISAAVIPDTAIIDKVEFQYRSYQSATSNASCGGRPYLGATAGTAHTQNTGSATTLSWDATAERPGGGSWSPTDLRDGTLTVRCQAIQGNTNTSRTYYFDFVEVQVTYHEVHAVTASDLRPAGSPSFGTPLVAITHNFIANPLVTTSPSFGAPADLKQVHALTANAVTTGSPQFDQPTVQLNAPPAELIVGNDVLNNGLNEFADVDAILMCSSQPADYASAIAAQLGHRDFTAGAAFTSPQNIIGGRSVSSTAIDDGIVDVEGIPTYWAAVDSVGSRLLAVGKFTSTNNQMVLGGYWTLSSFTINQPGVPA